MASKCEMKTLIQNPNLQIEIISRYLAEYIEIKYFSTIFISTMFSLRKNQII